MLYIEDTGILQSGQTRSEIAVSSRLSLLRLFNDNILLFIIGLFKRLFYVTADGSARQQMSAKPHKRRDGTKFWNFVFDVVIFFGGPEVKAQITWMEKSITKR